MITFDSNTPQPTVLIGGVSYFNIDISWRIFIWGECTGFYWSKRTFLPFHKIKFLFIESFMQAWCFQATRKSWLSLLHCSSRYQSDTPGQKSMFTFRLSCKQTQSQADEAETSIVNISMVYYMFTNLFFLSHVHQLSGDFVLLKTLNNICQTVVQTLHIFLGLLFQHWIYEK